MQNQNDKSKRQINMPKENAKSKYQSKMPKTNISWLVASPGVIGFLTQNYTKKQPKLTSKGGPRKKYVFGKKLNNLPK